MYYGKYIMALDRELPVPDVFYLIKGNMCSVAQKGTNSITRSQAGWNMIQKEIWSSQISVATEAMSKISVDAEDIHAIGITNQRDYDCVG